MRYAYASLLQARVLAEGWAKDGMQEADLLKAQIAVADACAQLAFNNIKKIRADDLKKYLFLLEQDKIALPLKVRSQILSRRANDLLNEALQATEQAQVQRLLDEAASSIAVWMPREETCKESKLTASTVWASTVATVRGKVSQGLLAEDEEKDELRTHAEAHL